MLYVRLARIGYQRNLSYIWSHMLTNLTSVIFGFIYIALWQAVAPETGDYNRTTLTGLMAMTQVFAYATLFQAAGLGIQQSVRTGQIALDLTRPVPYLGVILAREAGNAGYQLLYRAVPTALVFGLTVGFPAPASLERLLYFIPSIILGAYIAHLLHFTIGFASLWTTEIRWAHWSYHALFTLLAGAWVPLEVLPDWAGNIARALPFAASLGYPLRIYLGLGAPGEILWQIGWAVVLTVWVRWLTRQGLRRVVVQGG